MGYVRGVQFTRNKMKMVLSTKITALQGLAILVTVSGNGL